MLQVIYAAKSRSSYNVDLERVEEQGVYNAAKAIMVSTLSVICNVSYLGSAIASTVQNVRKVPTYVIVM